MSINLVAIGVLALTFFAHTMYALSSVGNLRGSGRERPLPWVPIDVSKSRSFVNPTRDAGMYIEATRRRAIKGGNTYGRDIDPRVNFWQRGSTNGTLETFFISAVCPALTSVFPGAVIYDGGTAQMDDAGRPIFDGGVAGTTSGVLLDFGGAQYTEPNVQQNVCLT